MIVRLTKDMVRLALRIKRVGTGEQLIDWRMLQLVLIKHKNGPYPVASPWFFYGCWFGHKETGVDWNHNHRHREMPVMFFNAHELDHDGRVVFRFENKLKDLIHGRYHAEIRIYPAAVEPFNLQEKPDKQDKDIKKDKHELLPPAYWFAIENCCKIPEPPLHKHKKHRKVCVIARFEVELEPDCMAHDIDQVAVDYPVIDCQEMCYGDT